MPLSPVVPARRLSRSRLAHAILALGWCAAIIAAPAAARPASAVEQLFDRLVGQPARLRIFLQAMPKGGDLHNHLWGGPYAEDFLTWAAADGLCVSRTQTAIVPSPCHDPDRPAAEGLGSRDPALYSATIDAMSMRGHDPSRGLTAGHDQFFGAFARFTPIAIRSTARMLASARASAARNSVAYLELMTDPAGVATLGALSAATPWRDEDFAARRAQFEPDIPRLLAAARAETDAMEAEARRLLDCPRSNDPACTVEVRFQTFALRNLPPAVVFGQLALAFRIVDSDPRYVGVNLVAPEDGATAVADYGLHMRMLQFFAKRHPKVPIALHAGELTLGLVSPAVLAHHIRDAVEIAGARRIGHGVAIAYENDAPGLLARMARERIAVEINLTSNDAILGVRGRAHPLAVYRAAGVPVVLSTDDEGVSRTDLTNEFLRAATEQRLRYADLKAVARASIDHAFVAELAKTRLRRQLEADFKVFETAIVAARF